MEKPSQAWIMYWEGRFLPIHDMNEIKQKLHADLEIIQILMDEIEARCLLVPDIDSVINLREQASKFLELKEYFNKIRDHLEKI